MGLTAQHRQLLERHRPLLRYDQQDDLRAMAAISAVSHGAVLRREDGEVIAAHGDPELPEPSLDLLAAYEDPQPGDHLVFAPDLARVARRLQADPACGDRVYGRVMPDGGRTWLQYWLWLHDNPKNLFGFGSHQGDWELVQVGLGEDDRPEVVVASQHKVGEEKAWSDAEVTDGHPVLYVAVHSHALYFSAGTHLYPGGVDDTSAEGPRCLPEVVELGPWESWPGRWGDLRRVLFGGQGPESPGCQGDRWKAPSKFASGSGGLRRTAIRAIGRALHVAGTLTYPCTPLVEGAVDGQALRVTVTLRKTLRRRARHLYVTLHGGGGERVVASWRRRRPGEQIVIRARLPPGPVGDVRVRASAYNRWRQRSDVAEWAPPTA